MKNDELLLKVDSWRMKIEDRNDMVTTAFEPAWEKINNSLRVFHKNHGGPVALQLRTRTPLTRSGRGKLHHMLAHVELTRDEAKELICALSTIIAE